MLEKLRNLLNASYDKNEGQIVPLAYDPVQKAASFPLFAAYIALILAGSSVVALHFLPQLKEATLITLGFWATATVFYLLHGGIGKAKIDLKNDDIELDSSGDKQ